MSFGLASSGGIAAETATAATNPTTDPDSNSFHPTKRSASFLSPLLGGAEKRPYSLRHNVKRGTACLGPQAMAVKKSRLTTTTRTMQGARHGINSNGNSNSNNAENVKRNANCMMMTSGAGTPVSCSIAAEKRLRPNSNHRIRVDPFVQSYIENLKKEAKRRINALNAKVVQLTERNKELEKQNQTFKAAVPSMNRLYQEANKKVTVLTKMYKEKESECRLLKLHMQRGTCTEVNNAFHFQSGF